ncbi:MAG: aldo/keto reductase [Bacillota bacterium]
MNYRKFENLDLKVSALGFGAMRLPLAGENTEDIDEKKAVEMIRYAIDNGVNYVDTAWPYHGEQSEILVGKALQDGYRAKVNLATKLPIWKLEKKTDMDEILDEQLEKLQTDVIDFYLLHALGEERWKTCQKLEVLNWLKKVQAEGKINYVGFSFHDDYELFEEIIDSFEWDFCQIQYNYLDTEYQAGQKGLKYAHNKGIGVIVMEPLRGGWLAQEPPKEVKEMFDEYNEDRTPVDWALQWLWSQEEVTLVLSGMSSLKQVEENVVSASNSEVGLLTEAENKMIEKAAEKMRGPITCTRCEYCMPCPNGVDIPGNFLLYNQADLFDEYEKNKEEYYKMDEGKRADKCVECRECLEKCPQNLEIIDLLKDVHGFFSKDQ